MLLGSIVVMALVSIPCRVGLSRLGLVIDGLLAGLASGPGVAALLGNVGANVKASKVNDLVDASPVKWLVER